MFTHLGQSIISQALSGHIGLQSGLFLIIFVFLVVYFWIFVPLAFDVTNGCLGLQTGRMAFWWLAYGSAHCVAARVVALP